MAIKVLGISASPRGRGNSYFLLGKALDGLRRVTPDADIDVYSFADKKFAGCIHCYGCRKKGNEGHCIIEDDFQDLASRWKSSDAIIYSVPVYHMSIPGQLKCFIDRLGQSGIMKLVASDKSIEFSKPLKVIGIISQGMHIFSGQEHAITELVNHALIMGCLPIAGDLWQGYIGSSGWTELLRKKDAIEKLHAQGSLAAGAALQSAQSLGKNVAYLAELIRAGKKALSNSSQYTTD